MIERKCNLIAPKAPPHYELLSHPLVHHPDSPSYLSCLDILHNAAYLLDLLRHLDLDENSNHGGLSADASEAFFWLTKMLEDTLAYVCHHLREAWEERETHPLGGNLWQSAFFEVLQQTASGDTSPIYSIIASCLNISRADVEAFVGMMNGQPASTPSVQEGRC